MRGTVEAISFTSGDAGNQWTTINGVRYATWWDFKDGIKKGAEVEFTPYKQALWSGMTPVDCANVRLARGDVS